MSVKGKPSVLIFMLDTQRTDNMGCYGYDKPTTPNVDRLAGEGVVFLDNISPAIWTLPSVASMMTGLHVTSHGSGAAYESFNDKPATLAEILADMGYLTAGFFANSYAFMSHKGFRELHVPEGGGIRMGRDYFEVSRQRIDRVRHWLDFNWKGKDSTPFFIYVQVMDPHMPLLPRSPFREQFALPDIADEEIARLNATLGPVYLNQCHFTERDRAVLLSLYDADTAGGDSHLGLLIDYMRQRKILDDTIVIVMSDHGEMFGEHQDALSGHDHFTHHLCAYEELIKVPLVVRCPKIFAAGKRVEHSTQTLDILPTLAEIIGFEAPQCQGFSLLGAVRGQPRRDFTLTEYQKGVHMAWRMLQKDPEADPRVFLPAIKAWRRNGMKYIWRSDLRDELYDLGQDPKEQRNLIGQMPQKAKEMRLELEDFLTGLPPADTGDLIAADRHCPPRLLARLRGAGWFLARES